MYLCIFFLLFLIQLRFTRAHAKVLGKIMPYGYTEAALSPVLKKTTKSLMGQHIVCLIGGHGLLAGSL